MNQRVLDAIQNNSEIIDWFLDSSKTVVVIATVYGLISWNWIEAVYVGVTFVYMIAGFAFTFLICKKVLTTNFSELVKRAA